MPTLRESNEKNAVNAIHSIAYMCKFLSEMLPEVLSAHIEKFQTISIKQDTVEAESNSSEKITAYLFNGSRGIYNTWISK